MAANTPLGRTHVIVEGDMLDHICLKHYGRWANDVMMLVWNANYWIHASHLLLPVGKILVLPPAPKLLSTVKTFDLWKDSANYTRA